MIKFKYVLTIGLLTLVPLYSCFSATRNESQSTFEEWLLEREEIARTHGERWDEDSIRVSLTIYHEVAEGWRALGNYGKASVCGRKTAHLYFLLGEKENARNALLNALKFDRLHANAEIRSVNYGYLAIALLRLGKVSDAKEKVQQAIDLAGKSSNPEVLAVVAFAEAQILYDDGQFRSASEKYETALGFWKQANSLQGQAQILLELSYAYLSEDRLDDGLKVAQESYNISTFANDLRGRIIAQNAIGVIESNLGKKQKALDIFLENEKQFPQNVDSLELGGMYNHLAGIYFDYGELILAQKYREKALEIFSREQNTYAEIATLSRLGAITFMLGDQQKGLGYFSRGFRLIESVHSPYYYAVYNQDLGNLYFKLDNSKSLTHYQIALEGFKQINFNVHIGMVENRIGQINFGLNNLDEAGEFSKSALIRSRQTRNIFQEAEALFTLAEIAGSRNDPDTSLDYAIKSIEITEALSTEVSNANLERSYRESVFTRYEFLVNQLMHKFKKGDQTRFDIRGLVMTERSKSRSFSESLLLGEVTEIVDASQESLGLERELRIQLNSKADSLSNVLGENGKPEEARRLETDIRDLKNQLEVINGEIKQRSPLYSAIRNPEAFDVGDFQANVLDEGSVLLEFSLGKEESYLWAVSKTEVSAFYLPSREVIEGRVEKLRGLLAQTGIKEGEAVEDYQNRIAAAEGEYKIEARALSEDLLGQAGDKIAGKRLIIVADGKLLYFPVGSLPMPGTGSDEPILLTNEVVYEPSASALKILKSERTGAKMPEKDLLVFADPVFSKTDERLTGLDTTESTIATTLLSVFRSGSLLEKLPRLPASEEEATSIRDVVGAGQTTVRSGFAANREGVINSDIENYKVLHFATHGLIDEKRPELSGILLSLYDKDGKAQDGGVIRLQDVYGLNLRSDLVVLSACETGIGKEVRGEGLMSLNNAFLQAGAKTVVSSLWKVDDTATKQLMTNFYRGIAAEGLTASAALRKAQIAMYQDPRYSSPFHWAAFTVQGDYQRVPQIGNGYPLWFLAFLILPTAVFGFYAYRRIRRSKV